MNVTNDGRAVDAGPAPTKGPIPKSSSTMDSSTRDGGSPPSWLVDGIAAAGGLTAAQSPQGMARNAGRAPER